MSVCRKCGGKLQGDNCSRHGAQVKAPPSYQLRAAAAPVHNPFAPDVDRRIFAMIGTVCKGCALSCGDLERCPVNRARWFGDWSGEFTEAEPAPIEVMPPVVMKPVEMQLSLF